MMTFTHCPPKQLPNLESVTSDDGKRYYVTPNGVRLPSVTTVVGAMKKGVIESAKKKQTEYLDLQLAVVIVFTYLQKSI